MKTTVEINARLLKRASVLSRRPDVVSLTEETLQRHQEALSYEHSERFHKHSAEHCSCSAAPGPHRAGDPSKSKFASIAAKTTIDIDAALLERTRRSSSLPTNTAVVEAALRVVIRLRRQAGLLKHVGKFDLDFDLSARE